MMVFLTQDRLYSYLLRLLLVSSPLVLFAIALQQQHTPRESPAASTSLICHSKNPAECYPAVFSPTEYFQQVHDDQSIPPGLHVRMNLATGLKEARLNVPEGDGSVPADVVVIDHTAVAIAESSSEHESVVGREELETTAQGSDNADAYKPLVDALVYNAAPPRAPDPQPGDADFGSLSRALVSEASSIDIAAQQANLALLTDLVHDVEWGVSFVKDKPLALKVWGLIASGITIGATDVETRSAAALLVGTALQNNAPARIRFIQEMTEAKQPVIMKIGQELVSFHQHLRKGSADEAETIYAIRLVFLASQLCQDHSQIDDFVTVGGDITLKAIDATIHSHVSSSNSPSLHKLRDKISNFKSDFSEQLKAQGAVGFEELR